MKKERNITKEIHRSFKLEIDNENGDNINNLTYTYTDIYNFHLRNFKL